MGGGLHMPTEQNDHRYGLKDYSLTYTGLYILENSMNYDAPQLGVPTGTPAVGTRLALSNTRSGQYTDMAELGATLVDEAGAPIKDALVTFELTTDGVRESWTAVTGADGTATAPARLLIPAGNYALEASFEGQQGAFEATTSVAPFVVEKEDTSLALTKAGRYTKRGDSKRRLVAVLTDADDSSRGVAAVPVIFRGRKAGVIGSSITDGNGKAALRVARRYWKKRTFRAVFQGTTDPNWNGSTLKIKGWRRLP
jgi:hypothetical protein